MAKKMATYLAPVLLGAVLLAGTRAMSQEEPPPPAPSMEEMMRIYERLGTPGPEHARFQEAVGTWRTEMKMWMGPGEPTVSVGTSKMEVIFGGRYLQEHYRCTFMEEPFEGLALLGYDNHKKKYVSVWLDNRSTGFMVMEGTYDEATKTTTSVAEYDDPVTGPAKMRNVMREISKDKHVLEMYQTGSDGQEQQVMEIIYKRQSS